MIPVSHLFEMNYVFSGKDHKYFNFDKWLSGKEKVLYIVGFSGSGKSTVGESLARKYKCRYISLDQIDEQFREKLCNNYDPFDDKCWTNEINGKVYNAIINFIKNLKEKSVIEGVQIIYEDPKLYKDKSVIILSTSLLISTLRAYNRNVKEFGKTNSRWAIIKDIYDNQKDFLKKLREFERIMES